MKMSGGREAGLPAGREAGGPGGRFGVVMLGLALVVSGCSGPESAFSLERARAHVEMLAGTIGSRPVGTEPNARARCYIVGELEKLGYQVRIQEANGQRPERGHTTKVFNIIATRAGAPAEAIGLVSHYDSVAQAPGAADGALGVAVSLEVARVLADADLRHAVMVIVTDGEEAGLMGATAAIDDDEVKRRLRAYLNLEAIGNAGAALLFETGPANAWIVEPWADEAPLPGGSSFAIEVYKRIPNDTDFSMFRRLGVPGLNFAAIGDSYAYHTARDAPGRLQDTTLWQAGVNALAIVRALDRRDLSVRTAEEATFFDLAGVSGVTFTRETGRALAVAAVALGLGAALRLMVGGWKLFRFGILVGGLWLAVGFVVSAAAAVAVPAAWRAVSDVSHPWYAPAERFLVLIGVTTAAAGVAFAQLPRLVPPWLRPPRHPTLVWAWTIPVWALMTAVVEWQAPAAAYLWTIPTVAAGAILLVLPARSAPALQLASALVVGVSGTLWIALARDLLLFMVPMFGRMAMVSPAAAYPAVMLVAGLMVVPPLGALAAARGRALGTGRALTVSLLAVLVTGAWTFGADAYTEHRPLRRTARYIQDEQTRTAFWEIGGNEAAYGLPAGGRELEWRAAHDPLPPAIPLGWLRHPFVFRAMDRPLLDRPAEIRAATVRNDSEIHLSVEVVPREPGQGLRASLVLPSGVWPQWSNYPGSAPGGTTWTASYLAVPAEGVTFGVTVRLLDADLLRDSVVLVRTAGLPGGEGWQRLPPWLPQERVVWEAYSVVVAPVGPLLGAD